MLRIERASKQFGNGFLALDAIDLCVHSGEIVSLIGTSGCGKSTLLRVIAGLDFPTSGQVCIDDEPITSHHPEIGIVFQEPRLMPWLTVRKNIQFGLAGLAKAERNKLTEIMLDRVGLTAFASALPRQLSGGMAQRVALAKLNEVIARALVTNPSILLLDEPFSALDAFTRMQLQDHLIEIWSYARPTTILVTHDIEEALLLSDRIIVLRGNPGRIDREYTLNLPRPRQRTEISFQHWKETLLQALDLSNKTETLVGSI